jgi:hypothetical protein
MSTPEPKEIREAFRDYRSDWSDIRDEGATDMQAISTEGPWSSDDRAQREDKGRPCIHLDQINQFLNQIIGNVRKSKRAVKATPKGSGANDQDAERRSSLIMGIEERSQAQPIYLYAFECMIERSYGFARLVAEYQDDSSFDQALAIKPVMNPDTVLFSPHYKQPDASDVPEAFLLDRITKKEFKNKYSSAKITNFTGEIMGEDHVTDWINDKTVQIAENWRVEYDRKKLLLVEIDGVPQIFGDKEWKAAKELLQPGQKAEVKRDRVVEMARVMQYLTNGVEILDEIKWVGTRIPIIACFGPERWRMEGGTAKRELLSMVRFARDPQLLYDYLASSEAEVAKRVPKVPWIGAKGQFESDRDAWENCTEEGFSFMQYDLLQDTPGGVQPPPPLFTQYAVNFGEWEGAKDSAARSLQAAMGITPLPDAAQRRNQKSGVALQKFDNMESLGSFHFVDRFENCFLHNLGWQMNEAIRPIYDTRREMPLGQPDGKRKLMQVVGDTSHPIDVDTGKYQTDGLEDEHIHTGKGEFDVTISTGPAEDSERDEQNEFVDQLLENIANLPAPGTPPGKVLALGIRMRPTLGPIGKQIADVFDPPDPSNLPPEAQAAIQQMQAQLQALQQENAALHADRAGRVLEQQTKLTIEKSKQDNENFRAQLANDIKVLLAEITSKQQSASERDQMYREFWMENHREDRDAAHEFALQKDQQRHDASQTAAAAQAAAVAQAQAGADPSQAAPTAQG